ncbi:MAG TPA: SPASM domain-containing protein [Anaerolineae bacterium]|nr:SPASM domain-containing protein [Anaerolineae bacterium]
MPSIPVDCPFLLAAWLHLTDRCNLRCDYCYTAHTAADMSLPLGRAAIDATFRSAVTHSYRAVKLKYAGGEPLLRFPLALELHRYAQTLAEKHGIILDGIVLSNGTLLTAEMVEQMQTTGLRLMISLDGIGATHDCQRRYADGRGSFAEVVRAIEMAQVGGLTPNISITISGRSIEGLPEVVAWVLDRDLPFSLNFYREYSCAACHTDLSLENERMIAGMLSAYKLIEGNLPHRSLLASLADRANLAAPHLRTCSAGQSYLVFDTQGRISKCQMDMAYPVTDCHDPDPLGTLRSSTLGLQSPTVDEKEECRECQWRYACGGGCPLQAHRATGRYDGKSPYCAIYKVLYPEVVRLEKLRLLKYAE